MFLLDFTGVEQNKPWEYGLFLEFNSCGKVKALVLSFFVHTVAISDIEADVVYMLKIEG